MKVPRVLILASTLMVAFVISCDWPSASVSGLEQDSPLFKPGDRCNKPDPPPSCEPGGGDGGGGELVAIDLTGDATAVDRPAKIAVESAGKLEFTNFFGGFHSALSFGGAAGSPTPGSLGGCVTDPPDLATSDPPSLQRLIDRLDDAEQERVFVFNINRDELGKPARHNGLRHIWYDDGDGRQYRTLVNANATRDRKDFATITEGPGNVFTITGGSITSWDLSTNQLIACPNGGSVTVTVNR
jgi:hypothetical protein